jgi:hypothetical protein
LPVVLGVDFSGGIGPWRPAVSNPTVWIATLAWDGDDVPEVTSLCPVQALEGGAQPFERLVDHLRGAEYEVAAIDAPFSLPAPHLPPGGRSALLDRVAQLPNGKDRPFPTGPSLIALAESVGAKTSAKPLRRCEAFWASRGVNTRSALWWKPRGGAPFAAACLALIARSGRPCWPWAAAGPGLLAEGFPAAQLRHWRLPFQRYAAPDAADERLKILAGLDTRLLIPKELRIDMARQADPLDAVLCALAAYAVATDRLAIPPEQTDEGWIAVMA